MTYCLYKIASCLQSGKTQNNTEKLEVVKNHLWL